MSTNTKKVSFIEKIKGMKLSSFEFINFTKDITSKEGEEAARIYLTFELNKPIEKVVASNTLWDPNSGERVADFKADVTEVRCSLDVLEEYSDSFEFEEDSEGELTGAGKYAGDLFLDLSKSGNVWLTDVKFSKLSSEFRTKKKSEKISRLLGRAATDKK